MKHDVSATIEIPEGVTVTTEGKTVVVKGPNGELSKSYRSSKITATVSDGQVDVIAKNATKREKTLALTLSAHIRNMVQGVTEGFEYKLKVCSGHFPMNVSLKDNTLVVKNYLGESVPRSLKLKEGANVNVDGDIITVKATDKELAGQCAAEIEKLCKRPNFDNRIFQDGIYIIEKAGKEI